MKIYSDLGYCDAMWIVCETNLMYYVSTIMQPLLDARLYLTKFPQLGFVTREQRVDS